MTVGLMGGAWILSLLIYYEVVGMKAETYIKL